MQNLSILLVLTLASTIYAQTNKLTKSAAPVATSVTGYIKGHCIGLPKNIRICKDPRGKRDWGTYLVGQWWRYQAGTLKPLLNKPIIARRYLSSFERERMDTVKLDRVPFRWLSHPNTEPVSTTFITKKAVAKFAGVIQEISTDTKLGRLKLLFKPNGAEPITLIYPFDEGMSRLDHLGDAASGRLYPKEYLPSQPDKWLQNKRATLRRYEDAGAQVLWLEH